jgi:hypothetical protein
LAADFVRVIPGLEAGKLAQLKRYFGVDKLMMYVPQINSGVHLITL